MVTTDTEKDLSSCRIQIQIYYFFDEMMEKQTTIILENVQITTEKMSQGTFTDRSRRRK
jgi:hypothetical protein